jgi:hypothetical protein
MIDYQNSRFQVSFNTIPKEVTSPLLVFIVNPRLLDFVKQKSNLEKFAAAIFFSLLQKEEPRMRNFPIEDYYFEDKQIEE